jgi:hypothetical protein
MGGLSCKDGNWLGCVSSLLLSPTAMERQHSSVLGEEASLGSDVLILLVSLTFLLGRRAHLSITEP